MSDTVPEYLGCPWPMDPACQIGDWETYDEDVQDRALALASSTLNRLTAYRVSNCPVTVRPTRAGGRGRCFIPYGTDLGAFHPGIDLSGRWVNNAGCQTASCSITLPRPVGAVYEIKVDGDVVDPADYRVEGGKVIYQGTDECPWLLDQDLSLPDTEPNTMSVTYLNAYPVDSLGAYAVGLLALQYAKACTGGKCGLPSGVTSIVRAGVVIEINPGMFPGGFTGIREIDSFIALWNPRGSKQRMASSVWSPDLHPVNVSGGN